MIFSQFWVFILLTVAGIVAVGLLKKKNMWKWICVYWISLTLKNLTDFIFTFIK